MAGKASIPDRAAFERDRYCEAVQGGREYRQRLARYPSAYTGPRAGRDLDRSARFWTAMHRADRWADYAGLPEIGG